MYKALFYKEWAKTKRMISLLSFVFLAFVTYAFINTGQWFRVGGAVEVWSSVILKDLFILPSWIDTLPLLAGLLLGFSQFVPEMTDKRLKLTLHLPLPEFKIIATMLAYGLFVLFLLFLATCVILQIGLSFYYPHEIMMSMNLKIAPWLLAGLTGYLFSAWICLEPVWKQRVFNALIAICILMLFHFEERSGAYVPFLPWLAGFTVISFSFPFYSAARFKEGAQ
ncbi:MAG: hypothetical protein PHG27_05460 [Massilibacteroides sp.]|nr:hypothetical protein [Massilibacteroides sp.]MDD3062148.1 hypothetical protein [Massilibacteroides sp.]MDD4115032.1 hypothetical protein [Massilibacteroides sp.]MDD4660291.1 hypothetical protein [Massilibacteroides sp.]